MPTLRFAGQAAAQGLAAGINALLATALTLWLAATLGPRVFGEYSVLLNGCVLALVLIEGGLVGLWMRERVAASAHLQAQAAQIPAAALGWILLSTLGLSLLAGLGVALGLAGSASGWAWLASLWAMAGVAVTNLVSARLRADGAFRAEALWQTGSRFCAVLGVLGMVWGLVHNVFGIFSGWGLGLALWLLWRGRHHLPRPALHPLPTLLRAGLPFLGSAALLTLAARLDILLLQALGTDPAQIGHYAAASRVFEAFALLFTPLLHVLQRDLRLAHGNAHVWRKTLGFGLGLAVLLGALGLLVGGLWAKGTVALLFGAGYQPAADILPWLMGALAAALPAQVLHAAALAANRERQAVGSLVALLVALALLLLWQVPALGAQGAAVALCMAHWVWLAGLLAACGLSAQAANRQGDESGRMK